MKHKMQRARETLGLTTGLCALAMIHRNGGASAFELANATGWAIAQARWWPTQFARRRLGLAIQAVKLGGVTRYHAEAAK